MACKFLIAILAHIVSPRGGSSFRHLDPPRRAPPTLVTLPTDILGLIFELLCDPWLPESGRLEHRDYEHSKSVLLLPLSQTCRHLRVQTLPWIFREVSNWQRSDDGVWPENLWPFLRTVHIRDYSIRHKQRIAVPSAMYYALAHMSALTRATLRMQDVVPAELVLALSLVPQLTHLEIYQARFDGPTNYSPLPFPSLESLLITIKGFQGVLRSAGIDRPSERRHVMVLLNNLGPHLASLQISGDLLPPDFGSVQWMRLCVFTVTEHTPIPYVPVPTLVSNMPVLKTLSVSYTPDPERDLFPPFTLGTHNMDVLSSTCPLLTSITLSNMEPTDPILTQLPPMLQSLHLLALRDGDPPGEVIMLPRRFLEAPLTQTSAPATLERLSYLIGLTELSLTLDDFAQAPLIQQIASLFPHLQTLELRHSKYGFDVHWIPDVRDPTILAAFRCFPLLTHLRISLNFADRQVNFEREQKHAARWLLEGLPTLLSVSFPSEQFSPLYGFNEIAWEWWDRSVFLIPPSPPSSPSSSADPGSDWEPTEAISDSELEGETVLAG